MSSRGRLNGNETSDSRNKTRRLDISKGNRKQRANQPPNEAAILQGINLVLRETMTCETEEEVARVCLRVAEDLTGSKFGFIGEINRAGRFDTIALSDPGWKACRMPHPAAVVMLNNMEICSYWGRVLKDGASQIVNDPATHPERVGMPDGHPIITCFLGVPLKRKGVTIGMIAVANKGGEYDLADQQALEDLSVAFVEALCRKRADKAIQEARRKVERLHEAAHDLEECVTEAEAYQSTVKAAEEILDFSTCTLDVIEGNKLVVKATTSGLPPETSRESSLDGGGLAVKTYRTGQTYVFGSLDEVPEAEPTQPTFKSGISVPIGRIGVFQVASNEANAFTQDDARMLELLVGHTAEAVNRIRLQCNLEEQATRDPLTGVFNRRYFMQTVRKELARAKRYDHPVGFLLIDINRFKKINDQFGHITGDQVLVEVANLLRRQVREADIVVRYGGDEFLIILPETNGSIKALMHRISQAIAKWSKKQRLADFPIKLAMGESYWHPEEGKALETILREADQRMYQDKRKQEATK